MKHIILLLAITSTITSFSQSEDVKKAAGFLFEYQRTKNQSDIDRALELIDAAANSADQKDDKWTKYYQAMIYKKVYPTNDEKRPEMILKAIADMNDILVPSKKFEENASALWALKLMVYDAYNEGLEQYNKTNYDNSFKLYKAILDAQKTLEDNKVDLTLQDAKGKDVKLKDEDILNNFVVFSIQNGKDEEAFSALEKLTTISPSANTYGQLIKMSKKMKNNDKYEKYSQEALEKYPEDVNILIAGVNYYLDKKDIKKSTELIEKAIKIEPTRADLYVVYGQNLEALDRMQDSENAYLKGIEHDADNFQLNYNLGTINFNKALEKYQDPALNQDANNYLPLFNTAKDYFKKSLKNATEKEVVEKVISDIDGIINQ